MRNIVVVTFTDASKAYQALSILKYQDEMRRLSLHAAAVVERDANGDPIVCEYTDRFAPRQTPHGLIGRMIDGLEGLDESLAIATRIPAGSTGLIAEVGEYADEVVDRAMSQVGGTVYRQSTDDVKAEFQAAESASRSAVEQEKRAEREKNRQERELKLARFHNERIERAEKRLDRLERWLEGQKRSLPSQPGGTA
jgi:uncharacterized membrane protein